MTQSTGGVAGAVARRAGVSTAVVAYVLNGRGSVPASTRARVLEAVAEFDYRPESTARAMRLGVSDAVVFLHSGWPTDPVAGEFVRRLAARCSEFGYALLACDTTRTPPAEWAAARPRAVLSLEPIGDDRPVDDDAVVIVAGGDDDEPTSFDYGAAQGELQVRHLIERGHRSLAYAVDAVNPGWFDEGRAMGAAWAAELGGLEVAQSALDPADREASDAAVTDWIAAGVTGIGAASDDLALSLLAACHRLGVNSPGVLSIIGADNALAGRLSQPSLSTIEPAAQAIADRLALRALRSLGEDVADPPDAMGAIALVDRASTQVPT